MPPHQVRQGLVVEYVVVCRALVALVALLELPGVLVPRLHLPRLLVARHGL